MGQEEKKESVLVCYLQNAMCYNLEPCNSEISCLSQKSWLRNRRHKSPEQLRQKAIKYRKKVPVACWKNIQTSIDFFNYFHIKLGLAAEPDLQHRRLPQREQPLDHKKMLEAVMDLISAIKKVQFEEQEKLRFFDFYIDALIDASTYSLRYFEFGDWVEGMQDVRSKDPLTTWFWWFQSPYKKSSMETFDDYYREASQCDFDELQPVKFNAVPADIYVPIRMHNSLINCSQQVFKRPPGTVVYENKVKGSESECQEHQESYLSQHGYDDLFNQRYGIFRNGSTSSVSPGSYENFEYGSHDEVSPVYSDMNLDLSDGDSMMRSASGSSDQSLSSYAEQTSPHPYNVDECYLSTVYTGNFY